MRNNNSKRLSKDATMECYICYVVLYWGPVCAAAAEKIYITRRLVFFFNKSSILDLKITKGTLC